MELVVVVIAELLFALVLSAIMALVCAVLAVLFGVNEGVGAVRRRGGAGVWSGRLRWLFLACFVLAVVGLFLLQTVFLPTVLSKATDKVQQESGMSVAYKRATANVFGGTLELSGVTVKRDDAEAAIDITADAVSVDADLLSLLSGEIELESLSVSLVKGTIERRGERGRKPAGRTFTARTFHLESVAIEIKKDKRTHKVEVDRLVVTPMRSDHILFDALFHSEGRGMISGVGFTTTRTEQGSTWEIQGVPVGFLSGGLKGMGAWLSGGKISARVDAVPGEINTDAAAGISFRITFKGLSVSAPEDAEPAKKLAATALSTVLRVRDPLTFTFKVDVIPSNFRHATSIADTSLPEAIAKAFTTSLRGLIKKPDGETKAALEKAKAEAEARRKQIEEVEAVRANVEAMKDAESLKKLRKSRKKARKSK